MCRPFSFVSNIVSHVNVMVLVHAHSNGEVVFHVTAFVSDFLGYIQPACQEDEESDYPDCVWRQAWSKNPAGGYWLLRGCSFPRMAGIFQSLQCGAGKMEYEHEKSGNGSRRKKDESKRNEFREFG